MILDQSFVECARRRANFREDFICVGSGNKFLLGQVVD
jgi:hypothetical protein